MAESQTLASRDEPQLGDGRILIRGLTRRFGQKVALHPVQLVVGESARGSITGLLGPNGSGKSTLLRSLTGLLQPDSGEAFVDGVRLTGDGTAVRARCSYSPGELSIYDEMKGREHLRWFLRGRDSGAMKRALKLAEFFGLPLRQLVRSYSHGMKRQLLFAATMAPDVRVRILDEPTEGLDPSRRADVLAALQADAASGTTILLSSHHLGEVSRACDKIIFLNEGRVLADESAEAVELSGRRHLRLTYNSTAEQEAVSRGLAERSDVETEGIAETLTVLLAADDPREFLASLNTHRDWPAPKTISYGDISLEDLYRSLYGVEGI